MRENIFIYSCFSSFYSTQLTLRQKTQFLQCIIQKGHFFTQNFMLKFAFLLLLLENRDYFLVARFMVSPFFNALHLQYLQTHSLLLSRIKGNFWLCVLFAEIDSTGAYDYMQFLHDKSTQELYEIVIKCFKLKRLHVACTLLDECLLKSCTKSYMFFYFDFLKNFGFSCLQRDVNKLFCAQIAINVMSW